MGIRRLGRPRYRHPHVRRQPRRPRSRDGARNRLCEGLHRVQAPRRTRQASHAPAEEIQGRLAELRNAGASETDTYRELSDRNRISGRSRSCSRRRPSSAPPMAPADRSAATPQRHSRRDARAAPRDRRGVRSERLRPPHPARRRGRARAPDPAPREAADAGAWRRPHDPRAAAGRDDRGGRAAARKLRLHESATGREDRDGHERRPSRGQVDDDRELAIALARTGRHVVLVDLDLGVRC